MMTTSNLKIREFFLGQLSNKDLVEFELRIIADASLEDSINLAESELMEDYLEETLTPDEKALFDKNFLITDERQQRLDLLRLLKKHAKTVGSTNEHHNLVMEKKLSFFDGLKNFFSLKPILVSFIVAISFFVLIGLSWRVFFDNANQNEFALSDRTVRELNQKDFSNPSEYQNYSNLRLISGNLRASGNKNSLVEINLTGEVFFRLLLPIEINSDKIYSAKIIKDGKSALTLNQIRTYQNSAGREIRLLLPSSILKKGEYQIELGEESSKVETGKVIYTFTIE